MTGCLGQKARATQWKALEHDGHRSAAYNAALEAITQPVVLAGAGVGKPNASALNQLRINENLLDDTGEGLDWQFRQFLVDPATHLLTQDTLAQTPD